MVSSDDMGWLHACLMWVPLMNVVNKSSISFEHFRQQRNYRFWRIELTTALTFGGSKAA